MIDWTVGDEPPYVTHPKENPKSFPTRIVWGYEKSEEKRVRLPKPPREASIALEGPVRGCL